MQDDFRRLFEAIDAPALANRELAIEGWQSVAQVWPLIAQTNRILSDRQFCRSARNPRHVSQAGREPRRSIGRCSTLAVISMHGGSGRTTLAANLVASLGRSGRAAVAVDLDPQNSLGLHFGIDPQEPFGVARSSVSQPDLALWFERFHGGASVLPFGQLTAQQLAGLEATLARDPSWLQRRLQTALPTETEIVIFDTPPQPSLWLKQVLAIVDTALIVVTPDAACYATLPATEALLEEHLPGPEGRQRVRYLVNRFDARRALDRDVLASLRGMMPDRVLGHPIRADRAVAESLARRRFVAQEGPDSQAAADIASLAEWVEICTTEARDVISLPMVTAAAK